MIISGTTLVGGTFIAPGYVQENLVLNLDAGNPASYPGSGTTWSDLSGNNNDATMTNPVWTNTNSGYFTFDGSASSYGVVADSASMSPTSVTWETWVQISGAPVSNYSWVVRNGWVGAPWFFGYNASNYWTLGINDNSTTYNQTQTSVVTAGWYQVVGTYDGSEIILYVNGAQAGTPVAFAGGNITGYGSSTIINGGSTSTTPPPNQQFWDGDIAVLRMYDRALSGAEVLQNFNAVKSRFGIGSLTIATNDSGGLTGWNPQALSVSYNPAIGTTYTVGSTITWQDNTTATITQIDDYGPTYIDIFWDIPKTGTLFPITLSN